MSSMRFTALSCDLRRPLVGEGRSRRRSSGTAGQGGAAAIRPFDSRVTGFRLSRRSLAEADRLQTVFNRSSRSRARDPTDRRMPSLCESALMGLCTKGRRVRSSNRSRIDDRRGAKGLTSPEIADRSSFHTTSAESRHRFLMRLNGQRGWPELRTLAYAPSIKSTCRGGALTVTPPSTTSVAPTT